MDKVIEYLRDWGLTGFPLRQQALVANAWPGVEYDRHDALYTDTQADYGEVLEDWNVTRLARELQGVTGRVICFGDRAAIAIQRLREKGRLEVPFTFARHLSARDLNGHIAIGLDGTAAKGKGARPRQVEVVAAEIATAIGRPECIRRGRPYHSAAVIPQAIPNVAPTKRADISKQILARQLATMRAAAAVVRKVMPGCYPSFPKRCGQDASTVLVLVLESIGIRAQVVQGYVSLDRRITIGPEEPSFTKQPSHWWVEACGVWVDLTYDQFADGMRSEVPPVSVQPIGKGKHKKKEAPDVPEDSRRKDKTIALLAEMVVTELKPTLVDLGF